MSKMIYFSDDFRKITYYQGDYIQYQKYLNNRWVLHNTENVPAIVNNVNPASHGIIKEYWVDGKLHRLDGPAYEIIKYPKSSQWYYNDNRINCVSQEEFEKFITLKAFW